MNQLVANLAYMWCSLAVWVQMWANRVVVLMLRKVGCSEHTALRYFYWRLRADEREHPSWAMWAKWEEEFGMKVPPHIGVIGASRLRSKDDYFVSIVEIDVRSRRFVANVWSPHTGVNLREEGKEWSRAPIRTLL